jgi:hypothetical protein
VRPVYVVRAAGDLRGLPGSARGAASLLESSDYFFFFSFFSDSGRSCCGVLRALLALALRGGPKCIVRSPLASLLPSVFAFVFAFLLFSLFLLFFCYRYHASLDPPSLSPPHRSLAKPRFALLLLLCSYETSANVPTLTRLELAGLSTHFLRSI